MIEELKEGGNEQLDSYLSGLQPFSVNMIAAIRDYPDRCRVLVAHAGNSIAGSLVEFHSRYNRHIWYDPIIWISGQPEIAASLLLKRGSGNSIIISQSPLAFRPHTGIPEVNVFEEYLLVASLGALAWDEAPGNVIMRRMGADDVGDSLSISGINGAHSGGNSLEKERNFLQERICLGLYVEGNLVSRGAIMSTTREYASVGAFLTSENERKKGYGTRIVSGTMKEAANYSRNACLFVRSTNLKALSLYSKLGFSMREKVYFTDLGTGSIP